MNVKVVAIFLCLVFYALACKKDDEDFFASTVDLERLAFLTDSFLCTAIKEVPGLGTIPWTANCEVYVADTSLEFRFNTYQDTINKGIRETVACSYVPIQEGRFRIGILDKYTQPIVFNTYAVYARSLDDGDVADGFWIIDTTQTNYIEITELDLINKRVTGKFDLHFRMKTQGSHGVLYSERINFKSGDFRARIE
jgi:hypothetical protein